VPSHAKVRDLVWNPDATPEAVLTQRAHALGLYAPETFATAVRAATDAIKAAVAQPVPASSSSASGAGVVTDSSLMAGSGALADSKTTVTIDSVNLGPISAEEARFAIRRARSQAAAAAVHAVLAATDPSQLPASRKKQKRLKTHVRRELFRSDKRQRVKAERKSRKAQKKEELGNASQVTAAASSDPSPAGPMAVLEHTANSVDSVVRSVEPGHTVGVELVAASAAVGTGAVVSGNVNAMDCTASDQRS